jgi:hypothetical protein
MILLLLLLHKVFIILKTITRILKFVYKLLKQIKNKIYIHNIISINSFAKISTILMKILLLYYSYYLIINGIIIEIIQILFKYYSNII